LSSPGFRPFDVVARAPTSETCMGAAQASNRPLQIMVDDLSDRDRAAPASIGRLSADDGVVSNHVDQIAAAIAHSVVKSPVPRVSTAGDPLVGYLAAGVVAVIEPNF